MNNNFSQAKKKRKILLINPPFYRLMGSHYNGINLGLSYIAAVLNQHGHEVSIYNADYYDSNGYLNQREIFENYPTYKAILNDLTNPIWREVSDTIKNFNPEIIGITMFTANYKAAKNIAQLAKGINKNTAVVVGGTHPTLDPEGTIKNQDFDYLIRGEGEYSMLELINGGPRDQILGLSYKKNGQIYHNPSRPFIEDLDSLPFPSRDLFLNKMKHADFGSIITGRGCPFNCSYCASPRKWQRTVRLRSVRNVLEELIFMKEKYNSPIVYFVDDTFSLNKNRAKQICQQIIDKGLDLKWKCDTRVDCIDEELINLMKQSGCIRIKIGVETGSEETMKKINKRLTKDRIRQGVKLIKQANLPLTIYLMAGFPGETNSQLKETIEFAKELKADYYSLSLFAPYYGTQAYDEVIALNGKINGEHWEYFYHQSPEMITNKNLNPRLIEEFLSLNEQGAGERV